MQTKQRSSDNPDVIHVAFACDDPYTRHVAVVIRSILESAHPSDQFSFHILTLGLSSDVQELLLQNGRTSKSSVAVHEVPESKLQDLPETRHTKNAFLRLLLPELLLEQEKVLYLDADVLVFRSLRPLWETDLSGLYGAACLDAAYLFGGAFNDHLADIAYPAGGEYFNSGVMLMNLDAWRDEDLFEKMMRWVSENKDQVKYPDQDAINYLMHSKIQKLDIKWNMQISIYRKCVHGVLYKGNVWVFHFADHRKKPWLVSGYLPYARRYRTLYHQTGFPPGEGVSLPGLVFSFISHFAGYMKTRLRFLLQGLGLMKSRT